MTAWQIRRAEPQDARGLAACIEAAYADYAARIADLPAVSEGIADDIAGHRVWVAERDGELAGGIVLVPKEGFLLLANVAVHPACAGLGIGRALIERAEADCRRLGLRELRLATHVAMPENVRLYRHLGWRETGRSGNKVRMKKTLPTADRA